MNDQISRAVHEAIGQASMCWAPPPALHVFDSERALGISTQLLQRIDALTTPLSVPFDVLRIARIALIASHGCYPVALRVDDEKGRVVREALLAIDAALAGFNGQRFRKDETA